MAPRKRTRPDNMPEHIKLRDIPTGVYWDRTGKGRWYTFVTRDGRKAMEVIGQADTRASDLHRIMEERGGIRRDSLNYLMDLFHESPAFKRLAARTQSDYNRQRDIVKELPTRAGKLGDIAIVRMSSPMFRGMLDAMAETPTKANHLARYLKRVFSWGVERGHAKANPLKGVKLLDEARKVKMPSTADYAAFAKSINGWLLAACELAYLCRLRRVEVVTLTEAHATPEGVMSNRRKGSEDNLTRWTPRLRAAYDMAIAERNKAWARKKNTGMVIPINAEDRPLFAGRHGGFMTEEGFSAVFGKAMRAFAKAGGKRFSIHGLKHRGITDSPDKKAGGHVTEAMRQRYDHEIKTYLPSGEKEPVSIKERIKERKKPRS